MRRMLALVVLISVLLSDLGWLEPVQSSPAAVPAFPSGNPVVYVDPDVVDLMWDEVTGAQSYKLYRKNHSSSETLSLEWEDGRRWSRVSANKDHADEEYKICAVLPSPPEDCGQWWPVHHEWVKGSLYRNKSWVTGLYELDGEVRIKSGARLLIGGVTVSSQSVPSASPTIVTEDSGKLEFSAETPLLIALKDIKIKHESPFAGSSIKGRDGKPIKLENVTIEAYRALPIQYCELSMGSTIRVNSSTASRLVEISHNTFENGWIELRGGKASISSNSFKGMPTASIDVASTGTSPVDAMIEENSFTLGNATNGIRVWPDTGGKVTIKNNTFNPLYSGSTPANALILWRDLGSPNPTDPPTGLGPPEVMVDGNLIQNVQVGAKLGSEINVEMRRNSFVGQKAIGIDDQSNGNLSRVIVSDNCIVRNQTGLYGTSDMDASGNWWGSSSGPRSNFSTPPDGGDIASGEAKLTPYLDKDNCDPRARNLKVKDIELIQKTHGVPLVEGVPTRVRVYIESATGETGTISGELIGRRGDTELGTKESYLPGKAFYSPDLGKLRSELNNSILFKLPPSWTSGTISLTAVINTDSTYDEATHDDNDLTKTFTFLKKLPVHVGMTPVKPTGKKLQSGAALDIERLLQTGELFRKLYPSHSVEFSILPGIDWPYPVVDATPFADRGKHGAILHNRLGVNHMRLQAEGDWQGQVMDQIYGAFPNTVPAYPGAEPTRWGGSGVTGFGTDHEYNFNRVMAINLGMENATIPTAGADRAGDFCGYGIEQPGYDVTAEALIPVEAASFVGPNYTECPAPYPRWIKPSDYQDLLDYNGSVAAQLAAATPQAGSQTYLLISGIVTVDDYDVVTAELNPAWQVTSDASLLNPPLGAGFCAELQDASNTVLHGHCFDLYSPPGWTRHSGFEVALPLTGSPARVLVRRGGGAELDSIPVSANAPAVSLSSHQTQSATGLLNLSWSGSDSDGDSLFYSLQYSADNQGTWLPAATNISQTHYTLDLAGVPGGSQAWVRVEASDGYHTSSDTYGPFVVEDHVPLVSISNPEPMTVVPVNPTLAGYAYDMEDGELDGASLVWRSNVDGQLGTGRLVQASGLTTGTHTLSLTATDSKGKSASDNVTVFVGEAGELPKVFLPVVLRNR